MDQDTPLYNSRIIKTYFDYLSKYYPDVNLDEILDYIGMTHYEVEDGGYWFSQRQSDRFQEILIKKTQNSQIAREVGRYAASAEAFGLIRQYLLGLLTAPMAYSLVEKFASGLSRATIYQVKKLGRNKVEIRSIPKEGVVENPNQCENRRGLLEAVAKFFTKKFATIDHPVCVNKDGRFCQYIVSWETTAARRWRLIGLAILALSLLIFLPLFFFLPRTTWAEILLVPTIVSLGIFLYSKQLENREIINNVKAESDSANKLIEQINLRYNEANLIQDIGQAISMILDIDELLKYVLEALEKRLDFTRGLVMLADRNKERLIFSRGYGHSPEEKEYLQNFSFRLDKPDSKGVAVLTFKNQTPYLIDDVSRIEKDISPKSIEFVHRMAARSFISVPIVYKGESLGILLVDGPKVGRKLGQSDLNLLMGIAPQIAISINNAMSYKKIQESEERFRSLSVNSPDIIYTLGNDGAFTYVNPAWERILGHPAAEVIGRYFVDFVRPEDIPFYKHIFKRTRDERQTVRDLTGIILHRNGTEHYFSISAAPNLDLEGSFHGVVGTFKDITDRKAAEAALQLRVAFEKLITSISTHFINVTPEKIRPEIHQALQQIGSFAGVDRSYIFRFQEQESLGENLYEWCAEGITPLREQRPGWSIDRLPWLYQTLARQEVFLVPDLAGLPPEAHREKAFFQERGVQSSVGVPMVFGGKLIGLLGFDSVRRKKEWPEEITTLLTIVGEIFTNALERIRVEEEKTKLEDQLRQSQKMEAIGRLAGGVAHDFNNMLTGIIGYADLLLLSLSPGNPLIGKVEEIKKAGKRAASLTQQLLAFSRKQLLQPKILDLNSVVHDLKKMLQRLIGEDIVLDTNLEPLLWLVKVDPNQMGQVLMNLVVNARDALPQGGKVIIRTANSLLDEEYGRKKGVRLQPGPYVLLSVQDNGSGMDPQTLSHIFEPFFTTKELGKGTGLGLSTVYGIIKQSGGFIWVESRPEQGTTFQIFLPRTEGYTDLLAAPSPSRDLLKGTETILVVEDNDLVRNLTCEALQQYGYRVIEAPNGEQALAISRDYLDSIHLLLTDVVMPGINGRELADQLLALRPNMKVIYMSGYTDNAIVQYGILEPGLSFIEKPFSPELLAGRVHQILNRQPGLAV